MTTVTQNITTMPTPALGRSMEAEAFITAADADVIARGGLVTELNTWAGQVNTVAGEVSANAATAAPVAAITADITTVAGIDTEVVTVAGISANVTTVAGISADVTTVAADATDIGVVAAANTAIGTVSTNIANVNTVAGISANVTTVAGISANVTTVAGIASDITAVAAQFIGWNFSTTTTMDDPGAGIMRFNNATLASVTAIALDDLNSSSQDVSAYVLTWDDSTSITKGTLTVRQGTANVAIFDVTGLTDNAGWTQLAVTHSSSSGSFANAVLTFIDFDRTGDAGSGDLTSGGPLGTPSSGTLTSCTGLPAAGVVGTAAILGANTFTAAQNFARATVASHATTADIWGAAGNQIDWTGTATTTIFPNAPQAGAERVLICAGACSFTAGANMLIDGVASAATVTCAANDQMIVRAVSTTQFKLSRVKYDGTAQVAAGGAFPRTARTTNTILGAADSGKWIDITGASTFAQTLSASSTLTSSFTNFYSNSGTGFVTLTPNGTETMTTDGTSHGAGVGWVLWPGEAGFISSDGSNLFFSRTSKGQVTTTIGGAVASVAFATGLAYRSKLLLSWSGVTFSADSQASLYLNTSVSPSKNASEFVATGTFDGSAARGVTDNFTFGSPAESTATGGDLMHGHLTFMLDAATTMASGDNWYLTSGAAPLHAWMNQYWATTSQSTITNITIAVTTNNCTAGTFTLQEM